MTQTETASRKVFDRDFARITASIEAAGAVVTTGDGFRYVDETKVSAQLVSAYRGLVQYGYANGLI